MEWKEDADTSLKRVMSKSKKKSSKSDDDHHGGYAYAASPKHEEQQEKKKTPIPKSATPKPAPSLLTKVTKMEKKIWARMTGADHEEEEEEAAEEETANHSEGDDDNNSKINNNDGEEERRFREQFEEALIAGDLSPLQRSKLMTTGPGRAGKSATVRSLLGKGFIENLESTCGMEASSTSCSVDRSERVVGWQEEEEAREGEFAEHAARAVAARMKGKKEEGNVGMKGKVISLKDDQTAMEMFDEEIIRKTVNGEETKIALSIWDLGGQEVFYTLHHLFLTKYAVYLCIFDMRAMVSEDDAVRESSMNFTNFWLRSIQMHAPGAPVFLIGTFKDAVTDPKLHKKIDERFRDGLDLKKAAPTLVMNRDDKFAFWPIDNTKGGHDPVIVKLRDVIITTVCKMEHVSIKVPLAATLILDKLMATKKRTVTMDEVLAISSQYHFSKKPYVAMMLTFFHELGMILYFSKAEELSDLVVLDPQWLVDSLTKVIRDFDRHPYCDDLEDEIRDTLFESFTKLKNEAIVSVDLMNLLWKHEDGCSEVDFTRRKFLISLMRAMNLSCPWRFGEKISSENDADVEEQKKLKCKWRLPPPSQYLVPSNLRLFRPPEIDEKIRAGMDKDCPAIILDESNPKKPPGHCFVIDFSQGFLPIGLFDRLVCLLVAHSSFLHKDSRNPLVVKGSALLSFGLDDFRFDEDLIKSQITVTIAEEANQLVILEAIEFMMVKLKDEVMDGQLVYRILIVVSMDSGDEFCLVELDKAREAVEKKTPRIRDLNMRKQVKLEALAPWVMGNDETTRSESTRGGEDGKIIQSLPEGKSNHVYLLYSSAVTKPETVSWLHEELVKREVKIAELSSTEVQKGISTSMCVLLVITEKVFEDETVQAALKYLIEIEKAKREKIPVILVQEGGGDVKGIFDQAPTEVKEKLIRHDAVILLKWVYPHEKKAFVSELINAIGKECEELLRAPCSRFLAFLSHAKKEAGPSTTLLHENLESRLRKAGKKDEVFLDCSHLDDMRMLPLQVAKSRVFVVILTELYLTRPWCLVEIFAALENKLPIVPIYLVGGGYDYTKAAEFLDTFSPETLDAKHKGASKTLASVGVDVTELGKRIRSALLPTKAFNFDPNEVPKVRSAQVEHILEVIQAKSQESKLKRESSIVGAEVVEMSNMSPAPASHSMMPPPPNLDFEQQPEPKEDELIEDENPWWITTSPDLVVIFLTLVLA